jgi:hypothetical protein
MPNTPSLETVNALNDIAKDAVMLLTAAAYTFKLLGRDEDASTLADMTLQLVDRAEALGLE